MAANMIPMAEKQNEVSPMPSIKAIGLVISMPYHTIPITSGTDAMIPPKTNPPSVSPKRIEKGEIGAVINLSYVLLFLSEGTAIGPVEEALKKIVIAMSPGISSIEDRSLPTAKDMKRNTGNKMPNIMTAGVR
jgi:hypothetical protein